MHARQQRARRQHRPNALPLAHLSLLHISPLHRTNAHASAFGNFPLPRIPHLNEEYYEEEDTWDEEEDTCHTHTTPQHPAPRPVRTT